MSFMLFFKNKNIRGLFLLSEYIFILQKELVQMQQRMNETII